MQSIFLNKGLPVLGNKTVLIKQTNKKKNSAPTTEKLSFFLGSVLMVYLLFYIISK